MWQTLDMIMLEKKQYGLHQQVEKIRIFEIVQL